jgi:hypothetical protein
MRSPGSKQTSQRSRLVLADGQLTESRRIGNPPRKPSRWTRSGGYRRAVMRIASLAAALILALVAIGTGSAATSHRNGCHVKHMCPSDHATYRWRGLLCVKPTSDERTSAFKRSVVYAGKTYFCHK